MYMFTVCMYVCVYLYVATCVSEYIRKRQIIYEEDVKRMQRESDDGDISDDVEPNTVTTGTCIHTCILSHLCMYARCILSTSTCVRPSIRSCIHTYMRTYSSSVLRRVFDARILPLFFMSWGPITVGRNHESSLWETSINVYWISWSKRGVSVCFKLVAR